MIKCMWNSNRDIQNFFFDRFILRFTYTVSYYINYVKIFDCEDSLKQIFCMLVMLVNKIFIVSKHFDVHNNNNNALNE